MISLPDPVRNLAEALSEVPSLGPRQATRIAIWLLEQRGGVTGDLARAIAGLGTIKTCTQCFFPYQSPGNLCNICNDSGRRSDLVMVVEKETDLLSVEATNKFFGRYCVIGTMKKIGLLDEKQKGRLESLKQQLRETADGRAEEIILGFNSTSAGDFCAALVARELKDFGKKITRLGRGIPTGGEVEFADTETLGGALESRR